MHRFISLRSSPLPQQPAGVPLTHPVLVLGTLHRTNAAAQGLQVSLRYIPQYLLLYRQLRHYPFQSRILLLQFLQPSGLV